MIKNIKGHGPVCYIPKFIEIESLVPRDKVFKAFQNIWAWKPSGYVTNILISSYVTSLHTKFCQKGQVVSSLSSINLTFTSNMSRSIHGHHLYTP